jgi:hypothetical protein
MIEVLISMRRGGERLDVVPPKRRGEIIAAKLVGAPWSDAELTQHRVVRVNAPAIQAALETMRDAGDQFPCVAYPFAVYDADGVMTSRSRFRLRLLLLSAATRQRLLALTKEAPLDLQEIRDAIQQD